MGAASPKQSTGAVVRRPAPVPERCSASRRSSSTGETLVIARRRFSVTSRMAAARNSGLRARARGGGDGAGGHASKVAAVRRMPPPCFEALAIFAAGMAAGTINTVVGSGTLVTFPILLAFGYAPVTANVSNNVGLVPGSVSGVIGYRRELEGQRARALRFGAASATGGIIGALLLLVLAQFGLRGDRPGVHPPGAGVRRAPAVRLSRRLAVRTGGGRRA